MGRRVVNWLFVAVMVGGSLWYSGPFLLKSACGINLGKLSPKEAAEIPLSQIHERYANTICGGLLDCYQRHDVFGQITVEITATIDENGTPQEALAKGPPPKVAKCIEEKVRARTIKSYTGGGGGSVQCRMSGTYMEGTQMIAHSYSYQANAETGGASGGEK